MKETISIVKQKIGFEIYGYYFMSNHVHIVLKEKNAKNSNKVLTNSKLYDKIFLAVEKTEYAGVAQW